MEFEGQTEVWTFIIVEGNVLSDGSLVDLRFLFQVEQTLFLNRTIEPLYMCVHLWGARVGVIMDQMQFGEFL